MPPGALRSAAYLDSRAKLGEILRSNGMLSILADILDETSVATLDKIKTRQRLK